MPIFKYTTVLGDFYFNEHAKLVDKKPKDCAQPSEKLLKKIEDQLSEPKFFKEYRDRNMALTMKDIKNSVTEDIHVNQVINAIEELNRILNTMSKRAREWYSYFNPEFEKSIHSHEKFIDLIIKRSIPDLLDEIKEKHSMGAEIAEEDEKNLVFYAEQIQSNFKERERLEKYLDKKIEVLAPNTQAVIGTMITAKLIEHARTIRKLVMMPASTIQLLGAEKALFRHLKNKKAKCPKFGVIFNHPLIAQSHRSMQGKAARAVADKISLAIKVDYFKGKFVGDKLREQLDNKFKK